MRKNKQETKQNTDMTRRLRTTYSPENQTPSGRISESFHPEYQRGCPGCPAETGEGTGTKWEFTQTGTQMNFSRFSLKILSFAKWNQIMRLKSNQKQSILRVAAASQGWLWAYFDNLRAIDLLQLREAVVDPFGVGSPLQQVQHIAWRETEDGRAQGDKRRRREKTSDVRGKDTSHVCLSRWARLWEHYAPQMAKHRHTLQLQPQKLHWIQTNDDIFKCSGIKEIKSHFPEPESPDIRMNKT